MNHDIRANAEDIATKVIERFGIYTIVHLITKIGIQAVGISRKSKHDTWNEETGIKIAMGRAFRALHNKINKKGIRHPFMG